jgi:hypothetical protein
MQRSDVVAHKVVTRRLQVYRNSVIYTRIQSVNQQGDNPLVFEPCRSQQTSEYEREGVHTISIRIIQFIFRKFEPRRSSPRLMNISAFIIIFSNGHDRTRLVSAFTVAQASCYVNHCGALVACRPRRPAQSQDRVCGRSCMKRGGRGLHDDTCSISAALEVSKSHVLVGKFPWMKRELRDGCYRMSERSFDRRCITVRYSM